jgi:segregation and condensation protein A
MGEDYKIKTEQFEGPLDLLLDLIEKRKLLINDISLTQITDDFINYVSLLRQGFEGQVTKISDFLVVASTLVLIKSKSLLPNLALEQSEEDDIRDLETRLKILQIIKGVSTSVEETFGKKTRFQKRQVKVLEPKFSPSEELNLQNMWVTILSVIKTFPHFEEKKEARVQKVVSLEDMMNSLINRVKKNVKMTFTEFKRTGNREKGKENRVNVIVSFLAMLELVKRGFISAEQDDKFEEINMESKEVNTPSFGV